MKYISRRAIKSMLKKEFSQILRDGKTRMVLFAAPLVMLVVFGFAVNTDVKNVKAALLDEDRSSESREIISRFTSGGYFDIAQRVESPKEFDRIIDNAEAEIAIHILPDYSERIKSGKPASIQLLVDGSDSSRSSVILSMANQIVSSYAIEKAQKKLQLSAASKGMKIQTNGVEMKERTFFNPELESRNFYLPGILGLLLLLLTIMLTSMSIVKEREGGTIEQIIVSPLTPIEYILGKTLPFAIIGFVNLTVISVAIIAVFDIPFNGSFIFLLLSGLLFIIASIAVGIFISTISLTQQQAMLSTFIFLLPSVLLSGFLFPISSMPDAIQYLTLINPMRYFMNILRTIFLKGGGIEVLYDSIAALAIFAVILTSLSIRRFARRLG